MMKVEECYICGCKKLKHLWKVPECLLRKDAFDVLHCSVCGFRMTSPRPSINELSVYYPDDYSAFHFLIPDKAQEKKTCFSERIKNTVYVHEFGYPLSEHVKWIKPMAWLFRQMLGWFPPGFVKEGRLLDVGCATGDYLVFLRTLGWKHLYGLEINSRAAEWARDKHGFDVYTGILNEHYVPKEKFDVVTAWHVLEHVPDPRVFLREVKRILKPNGLLLMGMPNAGSFETLIFRSFWWAWEVPRHLWHFDRKTLSRILKEEGFEIERFFIPANVNNWLLSVRHFLFRSSDKTHHFLFKCLDPDQRASVPLKALLMFPGLMLSLARSLGRMVVYARVKENMK